MKEKDITPEVIRLSKEIAELWRMKIYVGCWVLSQRKEWKTVSETEQKAVITDEEVFLIDNIAQIANLNLTIPIPDIFDCLEKLREIGERFAADGILVGRNKTGEVYEALLSALLEVLKNE